MVCQKCNSKRVVSLMAHCVDCCNVAINDYDKSDYVPGDMGIGGGDDVEIDYCLECGQIQGEWPLEETKAESFDPDACPKCGEKEFNDIGECEECRYQRELWCPRCDHEVKIQRKTEHKLYCPQCQNTFRLETLQGNQ